MLRLKNKLMYNQMKDYSTHDNNLSIYSITQHSYLTLRPLLQYTRNRETHSLPFKKYLRVLERHALFHYSAEAASEEETASRLKDGVYTQQHHP